LSESQASSAAELIGQLRERLSKTLQAQAKDLERFQQSLQALRERHEQLQGALERQLEALTKAGSSESFFANSGAASLDKVLTSVRNLIMATLPEQVFVTLAEEAEQMGVRAAVFDVRGKAAWGASARGFGAEVTDQAFRALVVPLNKGNPFCLAYETGGDVEATADDLKKTRNIYDKFKPEPEGPISILPVRSAGSVSALFYSDPGGSGEALPVDALKILAEFAGAQLDRLMALSGGASAGAEEAAVAQSGNEAEAEEQPVSSSSAAGDEVSAYSEAEGLAPPPHSEQPSAAAAESSELGTSDLSEEEKKIHKDARRFARLLVSEIELYNKAKVAEGRKNHDLYRRLKTDIERSRQTYEKRFGKTVAKQVDYFHQELVKTLAGNDPAFLGSDYPGPSV
jgi:hypothetical protein